MPRQTKPTALEEGVRCSFFEWRAHFSCAKWKRVCSCWHLAKAKANLSIPQHKSIHYLPDVISSANHLLTQELRWHTQTHPGPTRGQLSATCLGGHLVGNSACPGEEVPCSNPGVGAKPLYWACHLRRKLTPLSNAQCVPGTFVVFNFLVLLCFCFLNSLYTSNSSEGN